MQLSPKVRTALTVLATVLAIVATVLPAVTGVPVVVGVLVAGILTALAGFGIVPPTAGGVQVGVVAPELVQAPKVDAVVLPQAAVADPAIGAPEEPPTSP